MTLRTLLFGTGEASRATDVGLLVLRLGLGLTIALAHGTGKVPPSEGFIETTAELGFPAPVAFAWLAGLSESVGGLLIAAGLATRPAAFFLAFTMAVAAFLRHGGQVLSDGELPFLFFVGAAALLVAGGGRYALDRLLAPRPQSDVATR